MFERTKGAFSDFNNSIDDTGLFRKTASAATGKRIIDAEKLDSAFTELELSLIGADVERSVAEYIVSETQENVDGAKVGMTTSPGEYIQEELQSVVSDVLSSHQLDFDAIVDESSEPITVLFTGINGVGKTTTIAKMAYRFQVLGYSAVIANGDTFRAGAHEQLEEHASRVSTPFIAHEQGSDPAAVLYDAVEHAEANNIDLVLADTAGRLHTDSGLMKQLDKINRVVEPEYTVFVDEATAGQDAVRRASEFNDEIGLDGAILTKVDATDTGGTILSIPYATELPVLYLGTGEDYADLEYLYPDEYSAQIVGLD